MFATLDKKYVQRKIKHRENKGRSTLVLYKSMWNPDSARNMQKEKKPKGKATIRFFKKIKDQYFFTISQIHLKNQNLLFESIMQKAPV